MKRMMMVGLLGSLLVSVLAVAAPISLCDYHTPETSLSDMNLSFNYRYFDDPATEGVDASSGRVSLGYNQLYDSPVVGFTLTGNGEVALTGFSVSGGLGQGAGTLRYYLYEDIPFFGFGGVEGSLATGQPQPGLALSAGLGYGRFNDVTPLAKAFRIQQDLIALEAITAQLSDEVLMAIATEIGRQIEYAELKELVAAIETLIEDASGATLNARALLSIEDEILATGDVRYCGWSVQGGIGYEVVDPFGGEKDILLTLSADAAFAPEPGSQFLFHASFFGPFNITEENTLTVAASYDYALSEDTTVIAKYNLQRVQPLGEDAAADSQSASLAIAFNLGGANVSLQLALTKGVGAVDWSKEITISATMNLL
ncbi:MAG: hypothetical protein U9N00_04990 [Candidatus Bipolaricaulota bacterium]|nr:hypothetical protein [Candidatus Bipolaricaulota bacterium]